MGRSSPGPGVVEGPVDRGTGTSPARAEPGPGAPAPGPAAAAPAGRGLVHTAALVRDPGEVVDVAAAFLDEGLRAGDLPLLAAPPEAAEAVRRALGVRADAVEVDGRICLLGARAPDAVGAMRTVLDRAVSGGSGRLRVLAVTTFGPDPRRWREVRRYEAVSNALVSPLPVTAMCVYDRSAVPAEALDTARATHPELLMGGLRVSNSEYVLPDPCLRELAGAREPLEAGAPVFAVDDVPTLPRLRGALRDVLAAVVPDPDQCADVYLAASEVAANAFRHGRRPVSARVWADERTVVCTVTDSGRGHDDPFAGFVPAHGDDLAAGGMGLWLARKLWDSVDLLPGPAGGLTVRLATTLHVPSSGRGAA
ncbi:anti-sigma factor RsbA family regulatory protein [Geodermatophilus sp. SYSU D01119]